MFRPPALPPAAKMPSVNQETIQKVLPSAPPPPPKPPTPPPMAAQPPSASGTKFIFMGAGPIFPRADVQVLTAANAYSGTHFTLSSPAPKELESVYLDLLSTKGYVLVVAK